MDEHPPLGDDVKRAYLCILRHEELPVGDEGLRDQMKAMHLVDLDPHTGKPVPLDPDEAIRQLAVELHARIKGELTVMQGKVSGFQELATAYRHARADSDEGGIRLIPLEKVNPEITVAIAQCTEGVYSAQPTPRTQEILDIAYQRDLARMRDGLEYRIIYPESARRRKNETRWMETASAAGGRFRTCPIPFTRIIYVRGVAAFLPDQRQVKDDGVTTPGALMVTHPAALTYLENQYLRLWDLSRSWTDGSRNPAEDRITQRQHTILGLLANGFVRAKMARELDISPRALRSELAALREHFKVATDFQLALAWRPSVESGQIPEGPA